MTQANALGMAIRVRLDLVFVFIALTTFVVVKAILNRWRRR
jgi:hypothetical protein